MENLMSALEYIDNEIKVHNEKLIELRNNLESLKSKAHDLSGEYATYDNELDNQAKIISFKSKEVGSNIIELEREINKLNLYLENLWKSKLNLNGIIDSEASKLSNDDNENKIR